MNTKKELTLRLVYLAVMIVTLSACATTQHYENAINTWVGSSEEALVSQWGAPTNTYQVSDSKKILTYVHSNGGSAYTAYGVTSYSTNYCKTEFFVGPLKTIESTRWEGNMCRAQAQVEPKDTMFCKLGILCKEKTAAVD
jgi:hypothetical protein